MKKLIFILALLTFQSNAFSQTISKDSMAIRQVLTDFFEVFTNPDMKHFDNNCAKTFELLEDGEVWRRAEINNYVQSVLSKPKKWQRTNAFDFISLNIKKDFAWVNYKNTATIKNTDTQAISEVKWLESIILEKRKGKWYLLQMHSTPIKKAR
jgi:SnoaL-like domain